MLLSEAIRLGAMMKPQGVGAIYKDGKTCAMGAALDAKGELLSNRYCDRRLTSWPGLLNAMAGCPKCPAGKSGWFFQAIIVHLNDDHKWTREQIADWVELQEIALGIQDAPTATNVSVTNNNNQNEKEQVIA